MRGGDKLKKLAIGEEENGLKILGVKCERCQTAIAADEISIDGLCFEC
jgi:hypothetical protein